MKSTTIIIAALCLCQSLVAQTPGKPQTVPVILKNGILHIGNGQMIQNSVVIFENGKITLAADATTIRYTKPEGAVEVDCADKHIYPGFIAANSKLGLEEIEAVRATLDYAEVGLYNPNVRSLVAYNAESKLTTTVRTNGVLSSLIVPEGGVMPGSSSVVQFDAWNWEDAVLKTDAAIHLNFPSTRLNVNKAVDEQQSKIDENLKSLYRYFDEAKAYSMVEKPALVNLKFEAMRGLFNKSKLLIINVNEASGILAAVAFAKQMNIKMAIYGGSDAYRCADVLKANNIPVLLSNVHSLPTRGDEDVDMPYKKAKILHDAGILYALTIEGSWQQRNLPFMAGTTAAYGLTPEQALESITLSPAKILGLDKSMGSIEAGKDATLFISTGDALDMATNKVERAYIQGRAIELTNLQTELFDKYEEKYKK